MLLLMCQICDSFLFGRLLKLFFEFFYFCIVDNEFLAGIHMHSNILFHDVEFHFHLLHFSKLLLQIFSYSTRLSSIILDLPLKLSSQFFCLFNLTISLLQVDFFQSDLFFELFDLLFQLGYLWLVFDLTDLILFTLNRLLDLLLLYLFFI